MKTRSLLSGPSQPKTGITEYLLYTNFCHSTLVPAGYACGLQFGLLRDGLGGTAARAEESALLFCRLIRDS